MSSLYSSFADTARIPRGFNRLSESARRKGTPPPLSPAYPFTTQPRRTGSPRAHLWPLGHQRKTTTFVQSQLAPLGREPAFGLNERRALANPSLSRDSPSSDAQRTLYKAPLLVATDALLTMTSCCLCCRGTLHTHASLLVVVSLFGGPMSVSLRASPEMVHGGTIVGIQLLTCTLACARLVWHSVAQCALPDVLSGRNGNLVSLHSLSLSPDWLLPSSAALSPADSRGDQSDQVRRSLDVNSSVTQQEVLENWRGQFASVGASPLALSKMNIFTRLSLLGSSLSILCVGGLRTLRCTFLGVKGASRADTLW